MNVGRRVGDIVRDHINSDNTDKETLRPDRDFADASDDSNTETTSAEREEFTLRAGLTPPPLNQNGVIRVNKSLTERACGSRESGHISPIDRSEMTVSSPFSKWRVLKDKKGKIIKEGSHDGIDMAAKEGTPIRATRKGKVVKAGWLSDEHSKTNKRGPGQFLVVQHENPPEITRFLHTRKGSLRVKEGDTVEQGQIMAEVGNTGSSTGPHLHFEIRTGRGFKKDTEARHIDMNSFQQHYCK